MMCAFIKVILKREHGITLVELMVVLALSAALGSVMVMTIMQMDNVVERTHNQLLSVNQVQNAGHWIQMDATMAQTVKTGSPSEDGFPLEFSRTGWDGRTFVTTYKIVNNRLERNYSVNSGTPNVLTVARYIVSGSPSTTCRWIDTDDFDDEPDQLIFTVTSTGGKGPREKTETRIYEIDPRPN